MVQNGAVVNGILSSQYHRSVQNGAVVMYGVLPSEYHISGTERCSGELHTAIAVP